MKNFDKNDYEMVKKYEKDFSRAINSRYCTGLTNEELNVVGEIYKKCLKRQVNLSCGGCILQMMTSVGRLYFSFKTEFDKKKTKRNGKKSKSIGNNVKEDGERTTDPDTNNK